MSLTTRSYNGSNNEEMSDLLPHGLETSYLSQPIRKAKKVVSTMYRYIMLARVNDPLALRRNCQNKEGECYTLFHRSLLNVSRRKHLLFNAGVNILPEF